MFIAKKSLEGGWYYLKEGSYYAQRDVLVAIVLSMRWTYAYSLGVVVGGGIPSRGVGYPSKFGVN